MELLSGDVLFSEHRPKGLFETAIGRDIFMRLPGEALGTGVRASRRAKTASGNAITNVERELRFGVPVPYGVSSGQEMGAVFQPAAAPKCRLMRISPSARRISSAGALSELRMTKSATASPTLTLRKRILSRDDGSTGLFRRSSRVSG